ncbi:TcaA 3rd/4th domain-containing protein [Saliterribacillus persicus]|uniref:Putative membrane protein YvbJ n=1 Tax=Saliterribacillus persicus TaxID=930114 RepID=A0A368YAF0_9BACI|nr:hypothetical protein [Saliterribacillus persicus]RCW77240.1 putative membrane protein YvbJ [Saliterribacillus persicus]
MFCKNCGQPVSESPSFCKSCGMKVTAPERQDFTPTQANQTPKEEKVTQPQSSQKKKLFIIIPSILIVLALISVGAYFLGSVNYNGAAQLDQLKTAVEEGDKDKLRQQLTSEEEITDKYLTDFIQYFQDNKEALARISDRLEAQISNDEAAHPLIQAVETEKKFGIYPQYVFELTPVKIVASANFEQTELSIKDRYKIMLENPNEKLHLVHLPGKYELTFLHNQIYGEYEDAITIDFWETEQLEASAAISFEGQEVIIQSTHEEATLIVNDVVTEEAIGEETVFGPVTYDGSTTFSAKLELPWETLYADPVMITDASQNPVMFEFNYEDDYLRDEIYSRIARHVDEWIIAYKDQSISHLTVMQNMGYLKATGDNFDRMREDNSNFTGDVEQIIFDDGSFLVDTENDYNVEVITKLQFRTGYYESGEPAPRNFDRTEYMWKYHLVYEPTSDDWYIRGSDEVKSFETDKLLEWY